MHIDLWIGRIILGRYEKTGTSWLGNFAAGNISMAVSLLGGCWKNPVWFLGLLPGIFMLILAWSTRESIGYGDGLVILCMGCFYALGEMMAIVIIAITIAGIAALGLLIFGHKNRKSEFPFVPFLLGAHLVMWGIQR